MLAIDFGTSRTKVAYLHNGKPELMRFEGEVFMPSTFYVDEDRPLGANNGVYPNVGMPNVLLRLQGVQRYDAETGQLFLEPGTGSLSAEEFDQVIYDLTNFLYYVGEPNRLERQRLGIYVLLFLVILGTFTYLLNREFWKDVH